MTCKDCIHYAACKNAAYDYEGEDAAYDDDGYCEAFAQTCVNFSDKTDWVHIPKAREERNNMKDSNFPEIGEDAMEHKYFVTIDGNRIDLTDEQIEILGLNKRKNPFERVKVNEVYYTAGDEEYGRDFDWNSDVDNLFYEASNYFNDKDFAQQVALHQLLYRKLLKFSYECKCEDSEPWDDETLHYSIYYDSVDKSFDISPINQMKYLEVYFASEEGANQAIEKVVKPFMKEHPDFVW